MSNVHRKAYQVAERLLTEMEKTFEITVKDSDPEFGKMQSNLVMLVTYIDFTEEIIRELIEPTEGPIRQQINEWGPHAVWLCKALDVMYAKNSGE